VADLLPAGDRTSPRKQPREVAVQQQGQSRSGQQETRGRVTPPEGGQPQCQMTEAEDGSLHGLPQLAGPEYRGGSWTQDRHLARNLHSPGLCTVSGGMQVSDDSRPRFVVQGLPLISGGRQRLTTCAVSCEGNQRKGGKDGLGRRGKRPAPSDRPLSITVRAGRGLGVSSPLAAPAAAGWGIGRRAGGANALRGGHAPERIAPPEA
jgi:hypothetical protein